MRKGIAGFITAVILLAVLLAAVGWSALRSAYQNEVRTVQNISGAVIAASPGTEQALAAAVRDTARSNADRGAEILAHYGYGTEERMQTDPAYRRIEALYISIVALLLLLTVLSGLLFLYMLNKRKREQEAQLLTLLDGCLSGEFGFVNDTEALGRLHNPLFADALVKLGKNLRLKTSQLAEERDHTKTIVTDISHQLKTPISALKTCFSMFLEADSEAERAEFLTRCTMQMDKLDALTASLIQISRLESGMISLQPAEVPLTEVLVAAVNAVYHKAVKKDIRIDTADFADRTLQLDKKWTVEAVANILDNAVKYSPRGSCIRIRIQPLYSFVRIEIEDSGIGIPRGERNKVFRRFYRGSSDAVRCEEGSGVGLYLSRKILEEEGGTLSVRPAPAQGSIFVIQLPL